MKHVKATYSLPEELLLELNCFVESRKKSQFIAEAIEKALREAKAELEQAYREAACDKERKSEIQEWNSLELEGWDE